jgi:predicted permease
VSKAIGYVSDLNTPLAMMVGGPKWPGRPEKHLYPPILYGSALYKLAAAPAIVLLVLLP